MKLYQPSMNAWSSIFYSGHIICMVIIALSMVLPKAKRKPSAGKDKVSETPKKDTDGDKKKQD